MEINELKSVWKKANDLDQEGFWVSKSDLNRIIKKKSNLLISKVARSIRLKLFFLIPAGILILCSTIYYNLNSEEKGIFAEEWLKPTEIGSIMIFLTIVVLLALVVMTRSYLEIVALQKAELPLKESLIKVKHVIWNFINMGIYGDVAGVPIVGGWVAYLYFYRETGIVFDLQFILIVLTLLAAPFLIYLKNKRVLMKRFGPHLKAIDENLEELDFSETNK